MTSDHPLVGRRVRFGGTGCGIEGIVLAIGVDIHIIALLLECTQHPALPAEVDGARSVIIVRLDIQRGDSLYVLPPDLDALKTLSDASKEMLAALDAWHTTKSEDGARTTARVFKARRALETLLGLPITHHGRVCRKCGREMPKIGTTRMCNANTTPNGDYLPCEAE